MPTIEAQKNVFLRYTIVQQPALLFSSQISGAKQRTCFEFKTLFLKQLLQIIKIRSGKWDSHCWVEKVGQIVVGRAGMVVPPSSGHDVSFHNALRAQSAGFGWGRIGCSSGHTAASLKGHPSIFPQNDLTHYSVVYPPLFWKWWWRKCWKVVYRQHASIRERGHKKGHFTFAFWEAQAPFSGICHWTRPQRKSATHRS